MALISIVVPCYNEEAALPLFYQEITRVAGEMAPVEFEFLFVDDGSRDGTLPLLRQLAREDPRVRFLSFSRNFGKEAAMLAGLQHARGGYAALMDADLQDPPSLLPSLYRAVTAEGYDCAATCRTSRQGEPPIRSCFAKGFYRIFNRISDAGIVDGARDYRLMRRSVVTAILSLGEYSRFSKGIFGWVGFRTKWVPYEHVARAAGTTKWSFWKLLCYALEGIVAFSTAPLSIASVLGALTCLGSGAAMAVLGCKALLTGNPAGGWPMSVLLFFGGLQLLCTGILGRYLAKTYLEAKRRPVYLVRETETGLL